MILVFALSDEANRLIALLLEFFMDWLIRNGGWRLNGIKENLGRGGLGGKDGVGFRGLAKDRGWLSDFGYIC